MKAYYGSRFSKNMTRTPEGFLVCHNVPIARTGWYDYLRLELGLDGNPNEMIKVYRSPDEVFSEKAIASFEGKIVTDEHPPDLLTPMNSKIFTKGSVQNVRQSTEEKDLLLADLIIYDSELIEEIAQGKREVSCGYECTYVDNGDGTYSQEQICGNHVAVVEAGRAGDRVAIKDSKIKDMEGEKKKMSKKNKAPIKRGPVSDFLVAVGLKHYATDAEPEDLANVVDEIANERNYNNEEDSVQQENPKSQQEPKDNEPNPEIAALTQKVDKLTDIVTQLVQQKNKAPEDSIDEMIEQLSKGDNSTGDEEESVTLPVEEMDENIPDGVVQDPEERPKNPIQNADNAAMIKALKAIKPVIANISDPTERKKACDSVLAEFKKANRQTKDNGYEKILKAQKANAQKQQKTADAKQKEVENIGEDLKRRFNPHYKEVK